jgi:hypothetical protein
MTNLLAAETPGIHPDKAAQFSERPWTVIDLGRQAIATA